MTTLLAIMLICVAAALFITMGWLSGVEHELENEEERVDLLLIALRRDLEVLQKFTASIYRDLQGTKTYVDGLCFDIADLDKQMNKGGD
jgi:hypothetical protein